MGPKWILNGTKIVLKIDVDLDTFWNTILADVGFQKGTDLGEDLLVHRVTAILVRKCRNR